MSGYMVVNKNGLSLGRTYLGEPLNWVSPAFGYVYGSREEASNAASTVVGAVAHLIEGVARIVEVGGDE